MKLVDAGRSRSGVAERVNDAGRLQEQGASVHLDDRVMDQGDDPSFKHHGHLILPRMGVGAHKMLGSENGLHYAEAAVRKILGSDLQGHVRGKWPALAGLHKPSSTDADRSVPAGARIRALSQQSPSSLRDRPSTTSDTVPGAQVPHDRVDA